MIVVGGGLRCCLFYFVFHFALILFCFHRWSVIVVVVVNVGGYGSSCPLAIGISDDRC